MISHFHYNKRCQVQWCIIYKLYQYLKKPGYNWYKADLMKGVRVLSLDVTGSLLIHKYPIMQTYLEAAHWAQLSNPPNRNDLESAYKKSYKYHSLKYPCFGSNSGMPAREWWKRTAKMAFNDCGRYYSDSDFDRYFRRVYQYYGTPDAYEILPDVVDFLTWASSVKNEDGTNRFILGITSNTPTRTVDTVLPMMKLHDYFKWFLCCEDTGCEKPHKDMFDIVYKTALQVLPSLQSPHEILHIGDSIAADFCGSKANGFQSILLDRSDNPRVVVYQDWLNCVDYPGKTEEDLRKFTVKSLSDVRTMLSMH